MIDSSVKIFGAFDYGNPVRIDQGVHISTNVKIGDYVHIAPYVCIIGGKDAGFEAQGFNNIMLGARIICASDAFDSSGLPGSLIPAELKGRVHSGTVVMEPLSNIGTNSVVMPGARLRKGVMLNMDSVLFGDTVEWGVYEGNPAKVKYIRDGSKLIENAKKLGYDL
jgi:acetyltransferase-like isoleucine patch superfamily enzyme